MDAARITREARGRAGLTQRELARAAGMPQPAVARIETGDVVPRVDTLSRLLAACGVTLAVEPLRGEGADRVEIRTLLRLTPRQRLLELPGQSGTRFRPLEALRVLAGRRVRCVIIGEVAARLHGAPVSPRELEIVLEPERLNSERLSRAVEAMTTRSGVAGARHQDLRVPRGRQLARTRFGSMACWWPPSETYRRLAGAASEMPLATRRVLVASIDDVIDRWRGSGDELELLAATRGEIDARAVREARRRRAHRE